MRSTVPPADLLPSLAEVIDEIDPGQPGHLLVHAAPDERHGGQLDLGVRPLDPDVHPFEALAGFTAPDGWWAFGVRVSGWAHHVDGPSARRVRSTTTFLVDRSGREASVLRRSTRREVLSGPAVGTIPDLCRRVLGLPTAPPPPSTAALWVGVWLERILTTWAQPLRRRDLTSGWGQVAALHPAVPSPTAASLDSLSPERLVDLARAHASAIGWEAARLADPPVPLPDGCLPAHVRAWMDDGFFARWALGSVPAPRALASELCPLIGNPLGPRLVEVVGTLLA